MQENCFSHYFDINSSIIYLEYRSSDYLSQDLPVGYCGCDNYYGHM